MRANYSRAKAFPRRALYLRDLLRELVLRDIKAQYKNSLLGVAWSLINPLLQLLVFSFLFNVIMPLGIKNYTAFLFSGILAWSWFQLSMMQATNAITGQRELIRRPGFPAPILPAITVTTNLINLLIAFPLLLICIVMMGGQLTATLWLLPPLMSLQFIFTLSLAYFLATLNVLFRDTQHIIGVLLQLMFYITPVFFDGNRFPEKYKALFDWNPMAHLISAYRDVLLRGKIPPFESFAILAVIAVVLLVLGYKLFIKMRDRFVEEL